MIRTFCLVLAAWAASSVLLPSLATLGESSVLEAHARADARSDKLELYIEIHNTFTRAMRARHDNYVPTLEGLPAENPCTAERQPGRGMYHAGDATGTIPAFRRRLRRAPRLPQDALATAMLDAAAAELPAWNGAYAYYHRDRGYTTDACAQGNTFHRQLMGAYQAYFTADTELLTFIDSESRARRATVLQDTERRYGRNFRYFHLSLMNEVEAMRDILNAPTLDLDALSRVTQTIAAGVAEIKPRAESAPQEIHSDLYQGQYLSFLRGLETLVRASNALVTSMREPPSRSNDRQRRQTELDRALSGAIEGANRVRYSDRVR
ncbi:MAG: DUF3829 domain-containing protein [Polyangiales bacterium]